MPKRTKMWGKRKPKKLHGPQHRSFMAITSKNGKSGFSRPAGRYRKH